MSAERSAGATPIAEREMRAQNYKIFFVFPKAAALSCRFLLKILLNVRRCLHLVPPPSRSLLRIYRIEMCQSVPTDLTD